MDESKRDARARCLRALISDLPDGGAVRLTLERDESMVNADAHTIMNALRQVNSERSQFEFAHEAARDESLLTLPDVVAWCWGRDREWRRRIEPLIGSVRHV